MKIFNCRLPILAKVLYSGLSFFMPTKISFLVILVFLLFFKTVSAQLIKDETDPLGYGIKLGVAVPTIGVVQNEYSGLAGFDISIFFTKAINNRFAWYIDPGFSSTGFRNTSTDNRFNNYFLDLSTFVYFFPSPYNRDIAFIGGIRPSYLLAYNSQAFEIGNYNNKNLAINKNKTGQIDLVGMLGIGVSLSPVVNLEMVYNHSFTNNNTLTQIDGRVSTVALNLRLNAVALKRSIDGRNQSTEEQIKNYRKGVLLFMLVTPNIKEIKRLKAAGKIDEATLLESEIMARNTKVVQEMNKTFTFCPIFYFMDTSIYKIISGNLNGVFVNYNLQPDTSINVITDNYFIASFCEDISDYTKRKHFGLFVYDKGMNQLEKPFNHPSQLASPVFEYVVVNNQENKTRKPSYLTVPFGKLIGKLNTRLFRYL